MIARYRLIQILFLVIISLTLLPVLSSSVRANVVHILASNAYSNKYSAEESIDLLRGALVIACKESVELDCHLEAGQSDEAVLITADKYFMKELDSMLVNANSVEIPNNQFTINGLHSLVQTNKTSDVLFGQGYFQSRVFFLADNESCWQIGVKAKHDDPAPVNLQIAVDETPLGILSYAKGDQSWEILSLYSAVKPGAHWLRIWFINDYLDEETNTDRNAYMEFVTINQVEPVYCENI